VAFTGCGTPETAFKAQSRVRSAEDEVTALENWYATVCRGCGAGCGIVVRVVEGRAKKVEGNPDHPVNRGKLCARGQALVQEQYHPDRLRGPLMRTPTPPARVGGFLQQNPQQEPASNGQDNRLAEVSWDQALDTLAGRLRDVGAQGRAGEVVFITGPLSGRQALVADRFTSAYGAQWLALDTFGEAPLRQAVRRVLGDDRLPHFDLQRARHVLSFGADFLSTWLSPVRYGWEYGIFRQGAIPSPGGSAAGGAGAPPARPRGYLVQVDSRFSATAANADEWVPVHPGAEGTLALAIAQVMLAEGLANPDAARALGDPRQLDAYAPEMVAAATGVAAARIRQLARAFAAGNPSLALVGGSATAHTNGTDTAIAVLALNALAGAIGAPGGVWPAPSPPPALSASAASPAAPASPPSQTPSAQRAAPAPVSGEPVRRPAGTLADWQDLAARLRAGRVQAVLVYDANPAYELPAALRFSEALRAAPFVASFSSFLDETTALADLILPSNLPLEEWGDDVPDPSPGTPVVGIQQPVVRPFYDTRSVWDTLLALAEDLGVVTAALPWPTFKDAVQDAARTLPPVGGTAGPPAAAPAGATAAEDFKRAWVALLQRGGWWDDAAPAAPPAGGADAAGAALAALRAVAATSRPPVSGGDAAGYPYFLVPFVHNTLGTGGGAHLPWLQATPDPVTSVVWRTWVEVNPGVARTLGLREGDLVRLRSPQGEVEVPVYVNPAAPPDVLAMPLGQGHAGFGRWAEGRGVNPLALLAPLADSGSGALAYAATRVRLEKTGRRAALPKLEGNVPAHQLPDEPVIQITRNA
jgi:anaerobic selenocysteine-containing dehydrogenase